MKTLALLLALAVLGFTAVGCASHEQSTGYSGSSATTVTSK